MRILLTSIITIFLSLSPALAATVSCAFMSETSISKSGEWLKIEMDFMKLYEIFGDGLKLPLENYPRHYVRNYPRNYLGNYVRNYNQGGKPPANPVFAASQLPNGGPADPQKQILFVGNPNRWERSL